MLASPPPGRLGVVDVGGGSTELVVGSVADGVTWSVSLPLGSCTVTERDLPSDPPSPAELAALRERLARRSPASTRRSRRRPTRSAAARRRCSALVGGVLSTETLSRGLKALVTRPSAEVALALGLHAERARLLPAGLLLLDAASRALGAPLQLAGGGLREGVVMEQLAPLGGARRSQVDDLGNPAA